MSNIAGVLKEEISRLSRREVKRETDGLRNASSQYRSDIAALKRRVTAIEKYLKQLDKHVAKVAPKNIEPDAAKDLRYSAKRFLAQRHRLELSQPEAGFLLNVSPQTIYNWETGKTRPRPDQIAVIAAMRKLSKTAARAIVDGGKR